MRPISTFLRYVWSKDPNKVAIYINNLPYMIEKAGAYAEKGKHYFVFILPEDLDLTLEVASGDLD